MNFVSVSASTTPRLRNRLLLNVKSPYRHRPNCLRMSAGGTAYVNYSGPSTNERTGTRTLLWRNKAMFISQSLAQNKFYYSFSTVVVNGESVRWLHIILSFTFLRSAECKQILTQLGSSREFCAFIKHSLLWQTLSLWLLYLVKPVWVELIMISSFADFRSSAGQWQNSYE